MDRQDVRERYSDYIADLNRSELRKALEFYGDTVSYNGHTLAREQFFEAGIALPYRIAPDTRISLDDLVVEGNRLAVRLTRTGTAVEEYMGIKPSGRPVSFFEHAFYRLEDGKCTEVWSVIDLGMILAAA